jgi:putative Holliday junction resolvase
MRILGIDYGGRRVGLALSDELGITAQGLDTFDRKTGNVLDHVARLIEENGVETVVVGHPVSMSGRDNKTSRTAEAFAGTLRERHGITVILWDERLTSVEAKQVLRGSGAGKGAVDRVAAALILQNYLDSKAGPLDDSNRE